MPCKITAELRKLFVAPGGDGVSAGQIGDARMLADGQMQDREMDFVIQTTDVARDGAVIVARAFDPWLETFRRDNPMFKAAHLSHGPAGEPTAIGRWVRVDSDDKGMTGRARFSEATQLARDYHGLYADRSMNMVSVEWLTHAVEERMARVKGSRRRVPHITEAEPLSVDAVAVGSDRGALAVRAVAAMEQLSVRRSEVAVRTHRRLEDLLGPSIERAATHRHAIGDVLGGDTLRDLALSLSGGGREEQGPTLGSKIRALREKDDRSIEDVAASLPITAAALRDIEADRSGPPSDDLIEALAETFALEVSDLKALSESHNNDGRSQDLPESLRATVQTTVEETMQRVMSAGDDGMFRILLTDAVEDALRRVHQGELYPDGELGDRVTDNLARIARAARA